MEKDCIVIYNTILGNKPELRHDQSLFLKRQQQEEDGEPFKARFEFCHIS